jgi:hypothetical protein
VLLQNKEIKISKSIYWGPLCHTRHNNLTVMKKNNPEYNIDTLFLEPSKKEAVKTSGGPLLIIAGSGSYFLMPGDIFVDVLENNRGLHWIDMVLNVKRYFKVSYKTLLMRLVELNMAVIYPKYIENLLKVLDYITKHTYINYSIPARPLLACPNVAGFLLSLTGLL